MRLMILQLLAFIVCSVHAFQAFFPGSFNDCTPPTKPKPICSIDHIYCDNPNNQQQQQQRNINAAFVISGVEKNTDNSYNIFANYQAENYNQLYTNFAQNVDQVYVSGTGVSDATIYDQRTNNQVNPFRWSAKFTCKPQVKNGKCCIPDGLKLWCKFKQGGAGGAAINQVFGQQVSYYSVSPLSGGVQPYDPNGLFNQQLSFHKRDEEVQSDLNVLERRNSNDLFNLLNGCTDKHRGIKQFCWDCDCTPPSSSSTPPSSSSEPPSSSEP
ncbi:hypothetical protein K4G61_g4590, partial [Candida parapsilosis]